MFESDYQRIRHSNRSANKTLNFAATDGDQDALVAAVSGSTMHIQRIVVTIKTSAAQAITFQDSNSSPVFVAKVPASSPIGSQYTVDFGPYGQALTSGKALDMKMTAGNAGSVQVYGFYAKD